MIICAFKYGRCAFRYGRFVKIRWNFKIICLPISWIIVDFREISCRIFGVECEHPDHFLTTTAQLYYYFLLRNSKLNLIIEMFDVLWILFQDDRISRQKKWESVGRDRAVEI